MRQLARFIRSVIAPVAVALVCAVPAAAQVVFDAASNAAPATVSGANPTTITWNHTTGLAKKAYLTVGVSIKRNAGTATVTSVVYGTEAGGPNLTMLALGAATNGTIARAELFGLPGPTPGTHQITVTVADPGGQQMAIVAGAKSFSNVFQTAATGTAVTNTGNTTTPTVNVTNSALDYVVDAVAFNGNNALAASAGQTNAYNLTSAAPVFSGAGSIKTGTANTTMSWTAGAVQQWATVAVPLASASPQILFDAASSVAAATISAANPVNVSWSHSTTTAANRYIVVAVTMQMGNGAGAAVTTATYGTEGGGPNQALALIGAQTSTTNHTRVELWGRAGPVSGAHTITVSIANAALRTLTVAAGAQSFSNVDQNVPLGTAAGAVNTSINPAVAVTNSAYDYVVDAVAYDIDDLLTPGVTQDQRYQITNTPGTGRAFTGAMSGSRGYTNTTMQWTGVNSVRWAIEAVPLKQVTVALTKTASADVIKAGTTVTYTLTATNYTSAAVNNVIITDAIPAGSSFVSQTGCGGVGPVTCNIGTLAAGATSAPITVTVVPTAAGTVSNVATVSYNGLGTSNSSETVKTIAEQKVCASPGKDGAGGTLAGIKNDYWPGSASVAANATSITLGARTGGAAGNTIAIGDLLIVMQMQDAAFDTTNDETYGEGTGSTQATGTGSGAATTLNNAGRWEYVVATNAVPAGGGTLNLQGGGTGGGLLYSYTNQAFAATTTQGQRTFQVIRVPQYTTATLGSTLTALTWNGATGGILAIDVSGTLTLGSATVSVDGLGFRGGGGRQLQGDSGAPTLLNTDFRTLATRTANGSKGEGIAGTPRYIYHNGATIGTPGTNTPTDTLVEGYVNGSYGRGGPGNGGGGSTDGDPATAPNLGNDMNSGGGGGGNGGNGGSGGNGWSCNCPGGGQGGGSISPSLTRITMGGGGGAGTTNNGSAEVCNAPPTCRVNVPGDWTDTDPSNGYYSSGADGGGVIIIRALQATGTATLTANGLTGTNTGRDGPGGGGAGGSVLLTTQIGTLGGLTIQAKGGNGGNAWVTTAPGAAPTERHGPGGGGGGGYILTSSAPLSTDVSGGTNGVTTTANTPYGAQPGSPGIVQLITGNNVLPGGDGASCAIADLAVTNVASPTPSVQAGNNVTYTQTVTNNGPNAADGVVYMMPVPASATFVSMTTPVGWTCVPAAPGVGYTGTIICTVPTLANAATANFSLVVNSYVGTPAGYVMTETNSVSSNTPDSNFANNQATATTIVEASATADLFADMAVTITQNTNVPVAGGNINYTQTVSNLGSFTAQVPTYSITVPANTTLQSFGIPAGWTCVPAAPGVGYTGAINCTGVTLASGASVSFPMTVKVNAVGAGTLITATPSVASNSRDPYMPNNTASVTATVEAAGAGDVSITISNSPDPVTPGENYTYTVVATNNGPAAAANVAVSIPLPAGLTNFQSLVTPVGWACVPPAVGSGGTINCTIASLAAGASATFSPVVQVNYGTATGTTLNITTTISTTSTDPIGNDTASTSNLVVAASNADMAIAKTDSPDPVGKGQLITYRLTVTNNGPAVATNVTVTDPLDATVTLISATPSIGSCVGATTITCTLGTLTVGNSQFVNIVVQANSTGTVTNTATVSATQTDPVPANNSSTATTTVLAVTLVRLRNFEATQESQDVLLTWMTSFETDNLGFNLYREIGGSRMKLNRGLIAGTALSSGTQTQTHGYRMRDRLDAPGIQAQYYLEDVDIHGFRTMHGPIAPSFGSVGQTTTDVTMLSRVGQSDSAQSQGFRVVSNTSSMPGLGQQGSVLESQTGLGADRPLTIATPVKSQFDKQQNLASQNGLKIYVTSEGWQHVTRAAMVAAGFDPGADMNALGLYSIGLAEPFVAEADAIDFYGFPLDTPSTGARTYWLRNDSGTGKKFGSPAAGGGSSLSDDVAFTYRRTERTVFVAALNNNGDNTNMFGPVLTTDPTTQTFNLTGVDPAYAGNATLNVTIQGVVDSVTHSLNVTFNGHSLGTVSLPKREQQTFSFPVLQSWLVNGANNLTITANNGDDDVSVLVTTAVTYQHALHADNGAFEATLPGGRSVTVSGFTSSTIVALDVTDPANPALVGTTTGPDGGGGFAATLAVPFGGSHVILALDPSRILTPGELALNLPSTWSANNTPGGQLVIITNSAFAASPTNLVAARSGQGIASAVVNVDDVYDEYNFGIRDPQAIRSFLQDSLTKWQKTPHWVLLVGSASIDPRNYLGLGAFDFVPTKLLNMSLMKTASDDWFTDFNNDGIGDLGIGRIPARTSAEASLILNRIAARGTPTGAWANNALFVADTPNTYDFPGVANSLAAMLPGSMTKQVIRYDTSPNPHGDTVAAINNGALLVDYIGHGSTEIWGEGNFSSGDASALTNGSSLPVAILMTCLNGYFHDLYTQSLATALLTAPNGGAIAVWASSTLTEPDQQAAMNRELFRLVFADPTLALGDAVLRAKKVPSDTDVQKSWIFFGDPSMRLATNSALPRPPRPPTSWSRRRPARPAAWPSASQSPRSTPPTPSFRATRARSASLPAAPARCRRTTRSSPTTTACIRSASR